MAFTAESVPELSGKTFVITGANSGIGFAAAKLLAARRAQVVLACRDATKMKAAAESIRAAAPDAQVDEVVLDLGSLAAVRSAATELARRFPRIDVLVNNAGVMFLPYRETLDGVELQFGTNHLAHFALTGLLLPQLLAAPEPRVVTVASIFHKAGKLELADIPKPRAYDEQKAYGMSKLANLLFTYELDRRAKAAGAALRSIACHPGYSATNLTSVGPRMSGSALMGAIMSAGNVLVAQSAEMGALPTLYAAVEPSLAGGEYVGPTGLFGTRGYPVVSRSSEASYDRESARALWEVSERLTRVRFELGGAAMRR
jgi:NAD(P)-dependent dehydrogenase (short-subunit alcohol dehydrogenase family)